MKNNYLLHLLFLFFGISGFSQAVTVNGTYTAQQLVNVLMDTPCVTTSNHTKVSGSDFTGNQNSVGYFQNTNPGFPMAAGVVLSSGLFCHQFQVRQVQLLLMEQVLGQAILRFRLL